MVAREARRGIVLGERREAEVRDLHASAGEENVRGLQIAVHDARAVRRRDGRSHGLDHVARAAEGGVRLARELVGEALVAELHHEIRVAARPEAEVVDDDDVRMGQPSRGARLPPETLEALRIGGGGRRQELDRDVAPHLLVPRLEHDAAPAFADPPQQAIAAVDEGAPALLGRSASLPGHVAVVQHADSIPARRTVLFDAEK